MKHPVLRASKSNFSKLLYQKRNFIASVYSILALQVAITAAVAIWLRRHPAAYKTSEKFALLWFILSILLIFTFSMPMPSPVKLFILCIFSFLLGLLSIAASTKIDPNTIKSALLSTLVLFIVLTIAGFSLVFLGIDLSFMGFALFCALLALLIAMLVTFFVPVSTKVHKAILIIGIMLFSVFIAYDTNALLLGDFANDPIIASNQLYLDILNIFTEIVAFEQY
jgi:FtsH-binding integral membrane protein